MLVIDRYHGSTDTVYHTHHTDISNDALRTFTKHKYILDHNMLHTETYIIRYNAHTSVYCSVSDKWQDRVLQHMSRLYRFCT